MIEKIYASNMVFYVIIAVCGISVLLRVALVALYKGLIKEAAMPGIRGNNGYSRRFIGQIKDKFVYEHEKSYSVNNVSVFVDKYMYEVKMLGIKSSTWEAVENSLVLLCLTIGTLGAFGAFYYKQSQQELIMYVLECMIATGIIILLDALFDLTSRRAQLHTNICDYLENYLKPRIERGEYSSDTYANAKIMDEVDEGMLELIDSMNNIQGAKQSENSGVSDAKLHITQDDDRLLEDVISEYLT